MGEIMPKGDGEESFFDMVSKASKETEEKKVQQESQSQGVSFFQFLEESSKQKETSKQEESSKKFSAAQIKVKPRGSRTDLSEAYEEHRLLNLIAPSFLAQGDREQHNPLNGIQRSDTIRGERPVVEQRSVAEQKPSGLERKPTIREKPKKTASEIGNPPPLFLDQTPSPDLFPDATTPPSIGSEDPKTPSSTGSNASPMILTDTVFKKEGLRAVEGEDKLASPGLKSSGTNHSLVDKTPEGKEANSGDKRQRDPSSGLEDAKSSPLTKKPVIDRTYL